MTGAARVAAAALAVVASSALAQDVTPARSLAATCANCHGTFGQARGEMKPLAGKPAHEIIDLLNRFRSGAEAATVMHQISRGYTDEQLKQIASYFAAQQAPQ